MPANNITSSPSGAGPQSQQWNKGPLLFGACATPEFTLIDDGPTAYYAAFVGCISGREECCPFQTRGVAPSITSRPCFPEPLNSRDAFMEHCPSDYHKVHGHCCPRQVSLTLLVVRERSAD
ncbi:uncharacterized protein CTHT_0034010 [Thermochaetoides thermophila DSM 1495]|uniref:Uncharacterized protein n=1 Tax=Chaetomium thermophilum (strain DSM 1495 / CBS 144.50 / IMI 039719) TaxID=759272 RepID=G0S633_CHATD|nr:hypothetical protein CTHT_0034010 [Thermochaetoides thermophila DSM 1495]EGS21541.1 hypothetical protein CTHT_0034010 [Thermochaetoides thermophila DSM 1495]